MHLQTWTHVLGELRSQDKTQFSWIEINKCKQVTPFFSKLKSRKVFLEECAEKDGLKVVLKLLAGCCRSELTNHNWRTSLTSNSQQCYKTTDELSCATYSYYTRPTIPLIQNKLMLVRGEDLWEWGLRVRHSYCNFPYLTNYHEKSCCARL